MKLVSFLAAGALLGATVAPAFADTVYDWTISGTEISGSGTFTVGSLANPSVGPSDGYFLDGATGVINGVSITGLSTAFGVIDDGFGADIVFPSPNSNDATSISFSGFGVSLALSDGAIQIVGSNPFSIGGSTSRSVIADQCGVGGCASVDAFTLTLSPVAATPLPAALPLFAGGLGALGLLGWRRKRKKSAAIATA
jgi:hypothetical protein